MDALISLRQLEGFATFLQGLVGIPQYMEHPRGAQQAGEAVVDTDGIVRSTRIGGIQVIASLKVDTGLREMRRGAAKWLPQYTRLQRGGSRSWRA